MRDQADVQLPTPLTDTDHDAAPAARASVESVAPQPTTEGTGDPHLPQALRILARDIHCEDGVATLAILEAADEIDRLRGRPHRRRSEIVRDLPRWGRLSLLERLRDKGPAMRCVLMFAVRTMREAADEIERLRQDDAATGSVDEPVAWGVLPGDGLPLWRCSSQRQAERVVEWLREQRHGSSPEVVPLVDARSPTLTDAERRAIEWAARAAAAWTNEAVALDGDHSGVALSDRAAREYAKTLCAILERTK